MRTSSKFFATLLQAVLTIPAVGHAQATAAPITAGSSGNNTSFNPAFIGLAALAVVLFFAIIVLGSVLRNLSIVYGEKLKKEERNNGIRSIITVLAGIFVCQTAYGVEAETAQQVARPVVTQIAGMVKAELYSLCGLIVLELFIVFALLFMVRRMIALIGARPELVTDAGAARVMQQARKVSFWDRFHKNVPVEQEEDITLDHSYDGIRELDNNLPPWWKYGFYLTIIVAGVYMWYYHMGGSGPSSYDEYVAEVEAGEAAKAAYLAKSSGNVDENTVKMGDEASISSGKTLYASNCAACHAPDGGGSVGPNLTDDYWLHGGDIRDVFKSIKYGWADKGMKSWKDDFSPKQIADLSSFIKSLKGSTPATPKERQGELYTETNSAASDTLKTVVIN